MFVMTSNSLELVFKREIYVSDALEVTNLEILLKEYQIRASSLFYLNVQE